MLSVLCGQLDMISCAQRSPDSSALMHVDWTLRGDKDPDGTARPPRGGVFTWVVLKRSSAWLIRAAQNTNLGPMQQQPK